MEGDEMNTLKIVDKPSDLIASYIELRIGRTKADEAYAEWRKNEYDAPMQEIEAKLLDMLNEMGSDSIKAQTGTAYKKLSTSVTTADGAEFRRHVIGLEAWDLVDWRPNKTAVNDLIAQGEALPPGLNRTTFYNVNIRAATKGDRA
jgi:hypothetical protein